MSVFVLFFLIFFGFLTQNLVTFWSHILWRENIFSQKFVIKMWKKRIKKKTLLIFFGLFFLLSKSTYEYWIIMVSRLLVSIFFTRVKCLYREQKAKYIFQACILFFLILFWVVLFVLVFDVMLSILKQNVLCRMLGLIVSQTNLFKMIYDVMPSLDVNGLQITVFRSKVPVNLLNTFLFLFLNFFSSQYLFR